MKKPYDILLMAVIGIVGIFAIGFISGCQGFTGFMYGPDMTPAQLADAVYEDGYALGAMRSSTDEATEIVVSRIAAVRASQDPLSIVSVAYYDALRSGETQYALVLFAAKRLLSRVGIKVVDDGYKDVGFDKELFALAVDGYEEGFFSGRD